MALDTGIGRRCFQPLRKMVFLKGNSFKGDVGKTVGRHKQFLANSNFSNSGQIVVVLPLLLAIVLGATLLWSYIGSYGRQNAISIKSGIELNQVVNSVHQRVKKLLITPLTSGVGGADCSSLNAAFKNFRDFSKTIAGGTLPPLVKKWTLSATDTDDGSELINCLLTTVETGPLGILDTIQITIRPASDPDFNSFTRAVSVGISAISRQKDKPFSKDGQSGEQIRTLNLTTNYLLKVARLIDYALVFPHAASFSGARINVPGATKAYLQIAGSVYVASRSEPTSLDTLLPAAVFAASTGVVFDRVVDYRAKSLSSTSAFTGGSVDLSALQPIFKGGINTGVLGLDSIGVLPMEDPGPYAGQYQAWNQKIDYHNGIDRPLPDLSQQVSLPSGAPPTPPSARVSAVGAGATQVYVDSAANFNSAPNISIGSPIGSATGFKLDDTCIAPPGASDPPRILVYQKLVTGSSFTIDFSGIDMVSSGGTLTPSNPALGYPVFCGLIAVDTLNIYIKNNSSGPAFNYVVFGNIVANQINIQDLGSGSQRRLIIANPNEPSQLQNAVLPPGQSFESIQGQFQQIATSTGQNFFVPIFKSLPTNSDATYYAYRPYGAVAPNCLGTTVGGVIQPSLSNCRTDPAVGYTYLCDASTNAFCLIPSLTPSTATMHLQHLFTSFSDNLAFSLRSLQ